MRDVAGTDRRHPIKDTSLFSFYMWINTQKMSTYTGSVRLPSSNEAKSARTGLPGSRGTECLSKECSTVPPLPRSLLETKAFPFTSGETLPGMRQKQNTFGNSRPDAMLDQQD